MITLTEHFKNMPQGRKRGFTLIEVVIATTISSFLLAGISSSYIFMVKSSLGAANYYEMNQQSRRGLEKFADDVRMATEVWSIAPDTMRLEVKTSEVDTEVVDYVYEPANKRVLRVTDTFTLPLLTDVEDFTLHYFNLRGLETTKALEVQRIQFEAKLLRKVMHLENTYTNVSAASKIRNRKVTD